MNRVVIEGKTTSDENFPVASWLLPEDVRPHVLRFYAFARAADDIADSPTLDGAAKLAGLAGVGAALDGKPPTNSAEDAAAALAADLAVTGVTPLYARQLLQAFTRDARNDPTRTWSDLLNYCRFSAAPVGRFLIDSHGESPDAYPASDALCAALQILNHLQDIKDDYRLRQRVYLPLKWLEAEGCSVEELGASTSSPALRRVIDLTLNGVDGLVTAARPLPRSLARRGFRAEAAVIVVIAEALARLLRRQDPLARRVVLSKAGRVLCALRGVARSVL
ncbi:MAG: squalene/phytoene synthase family protein [Alphaproteobacteria bacterium]